MSDHVYTAYRDGKLITVPVLEDLCLMIKEKFTHQEKILESLEQQNKELRSEHYKDAELARLKAENDRLRQEINNGFPITDADSLKIQHWLKHHDCPYESMKGKISGAAPSEYRFSIIPGIGYNAYVKCKCGQEYCFYKE